MAKNPSDDRINQTGISRGNLDQTIGDSSRNTKVNILSGNVLLFTLVGIISVGALAWLLGIRVHSGQTGIEIKFQNQQQSMPSPMPSPMSSPSPQPIKSPKSQD